MPQTRQHTTHTRALAAAALLLTALAFLPARYGYWMNQLQVVPALVIGPSQWAFRSLAQVFVRPARSAHEEQLRALEHDRDQWKSRFYNQQDRVREIERRLAQYEAGVLDPERGISARRARVIGPAGAPGTQMLRIRAGDNDGVARGTVAVSDRVQVVGRVESVRAGESTLVLITQDGQPPIQGALLTDERPDAPAPATVLCQLHPFGDGTLQGMVEYTPARPGEPQPEPAKGQTVYLRDDSWPESSRMLVLGRVEEVRQPSNWPLRRLITVRPMVRLDRLTEVTLRIPQDRAAADAAGAGGEP